MTLFTRFYEALMDENIYQGWFSFIKNYLPPGSHLLDLACGTGSLTSLLAEEGYQMVGLDLDEDSLALAQRKLDQLKPRVPLVQADMRDFNLNQSFDGVICSLDSLCHLPDQEAVFETFQTVFDHLKPGAYFLFDVHSPYQMTQVFPGFMYHGQVDGDWLLWTAYATETDYEVYHELIYFIQKGDLYEELAEGIFERTYPLRTYQELLERAGFGQIQVFSDPYLSPVEEDSTRYYIACQKA